MERQLIVVGSGSLFFGGGNPFYCCLVLGSYSSFYVSLYLSRHFLGNYRNDFHIYPLGREVASLARCLIPVGAIRQRCSCIVTFRSSWNATTRHRYQVSSTSASVRCNNKWVRPNRSETAAGAGPGTPRDVILKTVRKKCIKNSQTATEGGDSQG